MDKKRKNNEDKQVASSFDTSNPVLLFTSLSREFLNTAKFSKQLFTSAPGIILLSASPLRAELGGFVVKYKNAQDYNVMMTLIKDFGPVCEIRPPKIRGGNTNALNIISEENKL